MKWLRKNRKLCIACRKSQALYRYGNRYRYRRDHPLCFRCYRAIWTRYRLIWRFDPASMPARRRPCGKTGLFHESREGHDETHPSQFTGLIGPINIEDLALCTGCLSDE